MKKKLYPSNPRYDIALDEGQFFTTRIYCTDGLAVGEYWQYRGNTARDAFWKWAGENFMGEPPDGWVRAQTRGADGNWITRRRTNGDPLKEYLDGTPPP